MKIKPWLVGGSAIAVAFAVTAVVAAPSPPAAGTLRAGAAKVDYTPPASMLAPGDTIRDRLYARAIVVNNGTTCAVLVGLDAGMAGNAIVDAAVPRAAQASGCPQQNIMISSTHTHSAGTSAGGLGGGTPAPEIANAIVEAVRQAAARLEPVRMGYGTTNVDLNVNRDLFDDQGNWRQAANPAGHSDKTLAVVEFIGNDNVPVGVVMNYAMHPVNLYNAGVISADFPGEAAAHIESTYAGKPIAIFTQGASGDQNPKIMETTYATRARGGNLSPQVIAPPAAPPAAAPAGTRAPSGPAAITPQALAAQTAAAAAPAAGRAGAAVPAPAAGAPGRAGAAAPAAGGPPAVAPAPPRTPAVEAFYRQQLDRLGGWVKTQGMLIGQETINVMRARIPSTQTSARIWGGSETIACPGRERLDNPQVRENAYPGYRDAADVNIKVGLLRLGDINFVTVNGEVYSEISARLKKESPMSKTIMVTLANGGAGSGYIYSDVAAHNLTFQVIGSRLKPYCAEDKIVAAGLKLIEDSQR